MRKILVFILCLSFIGCSSRPTKSESIGKWVYMKGSKNGSLYAVATLFYDNHYINSINKIKNDKDAAIIFACKTNNSIKATPYLRDPSLATKSKLANLKFEIFLDDKKLQNKEFDKPEFVNELIKAKKLVLVENGKKFDFDLEISKEDTNEVIKKLKQACNLK